MIANLQELKVAVRNLRILEETLRALRTQLETSNPRLLAISSEAYVARIASLQESIASYLASHPADVSLILPTLDEARSAVTLTLPPGT